MATGYDGEITLGVKLSPSDVKKSAQALQKEIEKIFETSAGKPTDAKFEKMKSQLVKSSTKAQELVKTLEKLENTKIPTKEYKELEKALESTRKKYNSLLDKRFDLETAGQPVTASLTDNIKNTGDAYAQLKDEMASLTEEEKYALDTEKIDAVKDKLSEVNNQTRVLTQSTIDYGNELEEAARKAEDGTFLDFDSDELEDETYRLRDVAKILTESFLTNIGPALQTIGSTILKSIVTPLKLATTGFISFGTAAMKATHGGVLAPFVKLGSSLLGIGKSADSAGISVKKLLMTFLRYGLGIRSLFFLFRKLRSAIKEGFNNLAQFNGGSNDVATAINSLKDSLTTLKNAWAAAFAPILQFVAPILQTLIDMLITAANAVASFFAALGGQSKVIKATKNQEALGSAIGGTGAAADKAKGQLASFDELNLLDQDSGGGGGGGGAGGLGFDYEEVESQFSDLAELFKKSWENADFYEIGAMVGKSIKDALDKAYDYLTDPIKDFCERLAKSLATFLNGMIEVDGLGTSIGKTIGAVFNDAFLFVNTFLKNFHWASLGKLFGESLISAFREFDWGNISTFLSAKWIALMDAVRGFVQSIDWAQLPRDIWDAIVEFVAGIDITGLVSSISALIFSIMSAVVTFLGSMLQGALELAFNIHEYFEPYLEQAREAGWNLIDGIAMGIWDFAKNIWSWLCEHVFDPIAEAFDEYFQIGSPSKLMEEKGFDIMQGLFNGIQSLVNAVIEIWDKLKNKVIEIFNKLRDKIKEIWNSIKTTVSTVVTGIKDTVVGIFNSIKDTLGSIVDTVKSKVTGAFNAITSFASSVFNGMKTAVVNCFSGMWDGIKGFINLILGGVEDMANGAVNGINALIGVLNTLNFDIPDWVPILGGKTFGLNLGYVGGVSLPRLAQGAVIPPNKEFMAVLGDQSNGTNIEAPLSTIQDAVREVNEENAQNMIQLLQELIEVVESKNLTISKREIGDSAIEEINFRTKRTGRTPILG